METVHQLRKEDLKQTSDGWQVQYTPGKVAGVKQPKSFLVAKGAFADAVSTLYDQVSALPTEYLWHQVKLVRGKAQGFKAQRVGINKLRLVTKEVATALDLPNADEYTSHGLRRTCATWLADSGVSSTELQRHFGWTSARTANEYVSDSVLGRRRVQEALQGTASFSSMQPQSSHVGTGDTSRGSINIYIGK